ncbi:MAG: hypothetical protein ACREFX_02435 [Opitutaceae bacterium]
MRDRHRLSRIVIVVLALGLPLLGAWAAHRHVPGLLTLPPPDAGYGAYPVFRWFAAAIVLALLATVLAPWFVRVARYPAGRAPSIPVRPRSLPAWGWVALAWIAGWWALAWAPLPGLEPVRRNSFFPLWLGFIVGVNALTFRRSGNCLPTRSPGRWLALFGLSAGFWWGFEWLNRFADNWHYLGADRYGPGAYAAHATLCFSTVLPAVAAVAEWFSSWPAWIARAAAGPRLGWLDHRFAGWALLAGGSAGLLLTGARPHEAYPALWLGPLALVFAEGILNRRPGVWRELAQGDWRRAATWMAAALICGFFWEMWNYRSYPQWTYTVPYVERWHLFEMPVLGYAGYLPFGLECLIASEWLCRPCRHPSPSA